MADEKIPVSEVRQLSSEGKSEREIIHYLKTKGFSNENISKALSVALKDSTGPSRSSNQPQQSQQKSNIVQRKDATYALPPQPDLPTMESMQTKQTSYGNEQQSIPMTMEEEIQLEELIEEMINERWMEIGDSLAGWDREISVLHEKVSQMEGRMKDLENKHDSVREDIREMLGETSDHVEIVEGRIGSMEKAFKEFLPSLAENVRSLSTIAEKLEAKTPKE